MHALPVGLSALATLRQFIVCVFVPSRTRPGKTDKFPVHPTTGAYPVNAHDSAIWLDAQTACDQAAARGPEYGVGFVLTAGSSVFFLDIDNCLQPDGMWSPIALQMTTVFANAYVEVSGSGRGIHILGIGECPPHGCKNTTFDLELYTEARFVALTGTHARGDVSCDCSSLLPWLVQSYFPSTLGATTSAPGDWSDEPCAEWRGPTDDNVLLDRALRSQSARAAFGNVASFAELWAADATALARAYPDPMRGYDESSADAALAQHLAFWTGKHHERILRLMRQSALVREKWGRDDYLPRTIAKACAQQVDVLVDRPPEPPPVTYAVAEEGDESPQGAAKTGLTFQPFDAQITMFKGCVYVADTHAVLVPGGRMLKPEQFKVRFGGNSFPMDHANERVTRDAWEAFTQSQAVAFPQADSYTFRPDLTPGAVVAEGGHRLVNTYWPINTPKTQGGDPSRFLDHLSRMIPNEHDRTLVLSYMAACVQHKGVKFQWAPFIQGIEGNGKTVLSRAVAFAVGSRYSHFPKSKEIASQFNGWMYGKVFIGVEDIFVPDSQEEVIEALKPMVTGEVIEIEPKGREKVTRSVCCNFIINSNHKNGLRKTRNDRRLAIIYTAQQKLEDLHAAGMTGNYFPDYYNWLNGQGRYAGQPSGYAVISELLHTYQIPAEFGLEALRGRAPDTASTEDAITLGMGRVEQEIIEAVDQNLPGFSGGWISSLMLDRMLDTLRMSGRIPPNRRRELLQSLGYDWHPGLPQGRVHNTLMYPDGGKPRLFVRVDGPLTTLTGASDIAQAYSLAQQNPLLTPATIKSNVVPMTNR